MKILIIKLGFSETLDPEISRFSSLGDVLRTTPILHVLKEKYPNSKITWVTDKAPYPLLKGNKLLDRILIWDEFIGFQLLEEKFDIVINLEKIGGICALTNKVDAWKKFGFRFDAIKGSYSVFDGAEYAFELCTNHKIKENNNKVWQEVLIEMIGGKWKKQPYVLGYKPKTKEINDVGFNYKVGDKFPQKAWPMEKWKELEDKLKKDNLKISWQEGLDSLYEYIEWINTNNIFVTNDSLGLHVALALGKKVVALFGPTSSKEVFFYNNSIAIDKNSMDKITVKEVYEAIKSFS